MKLPGEADTWETSTYCLALWSNRLMTLLFFSTLITLRARSAIFLATGPDRVHNKYLFSKGMVWLTQAFGTARYHPLAEVPWEGGVWCWSSRGHKSIVIVSPNQALNGVHFIASKSEVQWTPSPKRFRQELVERELEPSSVGLWHLLPRDIVLDSHNRM